MSGARVATQLRYAFTLHSLLFTPLFLRVQPMDLPGKGNRLANVGNAADPGYGALDAEPETRVDEGPVLSQIQVPVVSLDRQIFFLDPRQQFVVVVLTLRAADDLAVSLRREQIIAQKILDQVG